MRGEKGRGGMVALVRAAGVTESLSRKIIRDIEHGTWLSEVSRLHANAKRGNRK